MNTAAKLGSRFGCLLSLLGPLVALVIYPRGCWLFAFVFIGIAVLVLNSLFRKDPLPSDVADHAQRLFDGMEDVDDYEHLNPREPRLRELWGKTMGIYGLPEEWPRLDESRANELRDIIRSMRDLEDLRK